MPESTVTTKGQITIPKEVRDRLRIGAGDRVSFLVRDDGVVELRPATVDLRDLFGVLAYTGTPLGIAEMDEAIRDAATESCGRDTAR
jgi:AbrB family looped-hinge helix DNA binding protein